MSDDLNKKMKQITDALGGQEKLPENVMGLLSLLASSLGSGNSPSKPQEEPVAARESKTEISEASKVSAAEANKISEAGNNMEMLNKVRMAMERLNSNSDPRISLLTALRPFMSNRRQKKINNCINILRMSSLVRLMEEQEKGVF